MTLAKEQNVATPTGPMNATVETVSHQLGPGFHFLRWSSFANGPPVATWRDSRIGAEWRLLPAGVANIGLTEREEAAAAKIESPVPWDPAMLRPVHRYETQPLLVMAAPLTYGQAEELGHPYDSLTRATFCDEAARSPAVLTLDEVARISGQLSVRLPDENEWEYFCRGGTDSLFFFGDDLPTDAELAQYVEGDPLNQAPNRFGLVGLFTGEWCRTPFRPTYDSPFMPNLVTLRGGAAQFWPWQGSEWIWCASAMRMPSSDAIHGMCGARFVLDLV
jgi:hypothetical protein